MKYLGVDFGLRRIGLATSDGELASPLKVLIGRNFSDLVKQVKKEASGFDQIVVGMPEGKINKTVAGFIKALRKSGLEVVETDETLSTQRALSLAIEENSPKERRKFNDDRAAAIILQNYLDSK